MTERLSAPHLYRLCPQIPEALTLLGDKGRQTGSIENALAHLVRLRVSQMNHCCYCQRMHAEEARQDGEQQARLDVLPAWREATCFSNRERTALTWAESLTRISDGGVPDAIYEASITEFDASGLLELTAIILEINSWNRVSASFGFQPDL
ncbi:carboxymuconolactone decarboxylase family protein [Microbulbifer marinus]|uniref:Alkylhydroperoxidase AhpD family core domain-containing protein n=1 Tax=Microbulbifer marinus TaxID=658218 RepID=A0A1H3ZD27_9GAMM|nr:carboxymuconolactone decarboxylase family protein [Microbulbifer marinus]SEA21242.1 alkylhydroperoxidase AhpD family core domain-containing protein [Microbulbifer marinus]